MECITSNPSDAVGEFYVSKALTFRKSALGYLGDVEIEDEFTYAIFVYVHNKYTTKSICLEILKRVAILCSVKNLIGGTSDVGQWVLR